jgi:sugar phosphate isomerase/epimerase
MARAGIQLFSLRDVDEPLPEILEQVAAAGYDGVEFAYRIYDADLDAVSETLEETGLDVAGAHVRTDRFENDLDDTVDLFETFSVQTLTIPGLDAEYFESLDGLEDVADSVEPIADGLDDREVDLLYHNHWHEFGNLDGRTAYEAFFEAAGGCIGPQVDVGNVALGDIDPVALIERLGDVPQVHIKDVDLESRSSVPVGTGDVNINACADAGHEAGAEWFIYEHEGGDPLPTLETDAQAMLDLC